MKVTGPSKPGAVRSAQKAKSASAAKGVFSVSQADPKVSDASGVSAAAPVETLSALINLQSDGASRGKIIAAGRRALTLLDRIQQGLLDGRIYVRDLEDLAASAGQGGAQLADSDDVDLANLYKDIALRARVELAKLGH